MTPKKEAPRANARPEVNWKHESFYASQTELQSEAEQFAARWADAAERFASSFFRALSDPPIPAVEVALQAVRDADLRFSRQHFPSVEHWQLVALLCAFAEHRERPTVARVLALAQLGAIDLPGGGGDPLAELRDLLERESSAAGLPSWAGELRECARRAKQVSRLRHRLLGWLADPIGNASAATPIVPASPRFSSRAIAAVFGGAHHG